MKKVSIIVPVFNVEKYIEKCINSILVQTYSNIELILVNDGSKQNEDFIIRKYLDLDCNVKIKYIKKEQNEGLFMARVTGVKAATGDYIEFVDSDDFIDRDYVRSLVRQIELDNADIAYSTTVICSPEGKNSVFSLMETMFHLFPIGGVDIKKIFFSQEGTAYSWHTMWNKIYRRELWDICMPIFDKVDNHLVMLEDVLFSNVLLYYAQKLTVNKEAVYYYCQHNDASTGLGRLAEKDFIKKVEDIAYVFDFLEKFFDDKECWIKESIFRHRQMYSRIWNDALDRVDEESRERCKTAVDAISVDRGTTTLFGDGYFYTVNTEYNNKLNEIKRHLIDGNEKYISFDVFETAINRPFYNPTDLFYLLDKEFEKNHICGSSFHTIRIEGERGCRNKLIEFEDVRLDEIYQYISEIYSIPMDVCNKMKDYEILLECHFNSRRETVYHLYKLALDLGKIVVFTSDMYLDRNTIEKILHKCGYKEYYDIFVSSEYRKTKRSSNLYEVLINRLNCSTGDILHLGDNKISDYEKPSKKGVHAVWVPNSATAFRKNSSFSTKGDDISGYGCLLQTAINKYYDNPFVSYHPLSNYGIDPYYMGLMPLGMNIVGQVIRIAEYIRSNSIDRIIFTSRDGYLVKKAFDDYQKLCGDKIETQYRYTSRKAMLPIMINCRTDFLNLPIVINQYSPKKILELLEFCTVDNIEDQFSKNDYKFKTINEYHKFMVYFLDNLYSKEKHNFAKQIVCAYWQDITDNDLIYDMGYSAAIHNAIVMACGNNPKAIFIHSDKEKHMHFARLGGFDIECIMDEIPTVSGLIREYFFSEQAPSCIGYKYDNGEVIPIFEEYKKRYTDLYPLELMQRGALDLNLDFWKAFSEYTSFLDFRITDIMRPFEIYLLNMRKIDYKAFSASYFEDKVYGGADSLNVRNFWMQHISHLKDRSDENVLQELEDLKKDMGKKKIAYWGTGKICRELLEKYPSIVIDYFFDNAEQNDGTCINGIPVIKPYDLSKYKDVLIIIVCAMYLEIGAQLDNNGLCQYKDYVTYLDVF